MTNRIDFSNLIAGHVNRYISVSEMMSSILVELKESLLLFDSKKLNKVLDEKMVVSEELTAVNQVVVTIVAERYGEFSEKTTLQLIEEFPALKDNWNTLKAYMKVIKSTLQEIRRILNSLEKYNHDLIQGLSVKKKAKYGYGSGRYPKKKIIP